jgi:hypothetical protein
LPCILSPRPVLCVGNCVYGFRSILRGSFFAILALKVLSTFTTQQLRLRRLLLRRLWLLRVEYTSAYATNVLPVLLLLLVGWLLLLLLLLRMMMLVVMLRLLLLLLLPLLRKLL